MKEWVRSVTVLLMVLFLVGCSGGGGGSSDRAQIEAMPEKFIQAHLTRDVTLMRSLLADQVELCVEYRGQLDCDSMSGDLAAQLASVPDDPNKTMTVLARNVTISGDRATLTFTMRIVYPDGQDFTRGGSADLRRESGGWRVYRMVAPL